VTRCEEEKACLDTWLVVPALEPNAVAERENPGDERLVKISADIQSYGITNNNIEGSRSMTETGWASPASRCVSGFSATSAKSLKTNLWAGAENVLPPEPWNLPFVSLAMVGCRLICPVVEVYTR
jgi:hypothetical protein